MNLGAFLMANPQLKGMIGKSGNSQDGASPAQTRRGVGLGQYAMGAPNRRASMPVPVQGAEALPQPVIDARAIFQNPLNQASMLAKLASMSGRNRQQNQVAPRMFVPIG